MEYALAWQALQNDLCAGCGQPRSESFAIENNEGYDAHALVCHGCAARDALAARRADNKADNDGLHITVRKHRDS